jgi:hypothetical protein
MRRRNALIFAVLAVLAGAAGRSAPHLDRLVLDRLRNEPATTTAAPALAEPGRYDHSLKLRAPVALAAGLAVECLLVGLLLYLTLSPARVAGVIASISGFHRAVGVILLAALVMGMIGGSDRATFPFVPWRMYGGAPRTDPVIHHFVGTTYRGEDVRLDIDRAVPTLAPLRFNRMLINQVGAIDGEPDASRRNELQRQHEATLAALGRLYNGQHPEDPLRTLAVVEGVVPMASYEDRSSVAWINRWEVRVPPDLPD